MSMLGSEDSYPMIQITSRCFVTMASSTDNDDSSSSDTDEDSVFYDANTSLVNGDAITPLQNEPRWRISSKNTNTQQTEHFFTISLTENQLEEIERRDKLQRLRSQEKKDLRTNNHDTSATPRRDQSKKTATSSTPDLLKDHLDQERTKKSNKDTSSNSSTDVPKHQTSSSLTNSSKTTRDSNLVDLSLIDRLTRFGAFSPNSETLADEDILRQPIVRNLDNGKYVPFSDANPMTQTILERVQASESAVSSPRRNSIFKTHSLRRNSSDMPSQSRDSTDDLNSRAKRKSFAHTNDDEPNSSSSESSSTKSSQNTAMSSSSAASKSSNSVSNSNHSFLQGGKRQLSKLVMRNFFRRNKKKTNGEIDDDDDENERVLINDGSNGDLKYKASRNIRDQAQFDKTQLLQTIVRAHDGPIWCMRFSPDGHLIATGGQDSLLKVWLFKSARPHFEDFTRLTNNPSKQQNEILSKRFHEFHQKMLQQSNASTINGRLGLTENQAPLYPEPFCELVGHQAPVLDVAWSKSLFLLSSSMDKTVRLWHLSRSECLCFFRHVDFVSAIAFHPRDDRYFVSASLDGHVRLWNIPDKRVIYWTLIPSQASSQIAAAQANLITAVNFGDDGRKVNVGTFDGRFLLYTDALQYDTVLNIGDKDGNRSHRSRKKRRKARKITGIESMNTNNSKVLITSNDSRIRLYNIRTKQIERKYRGYSNQSSQIRATFSHDDQYIISGSEDNWFYIWKTEPDVPLEASSNQTKSSRKQRHNFDRAFEKIQVHNSMVTSAIFAPNPTGIMEYLYQSNESSGSTRSHHHLQSRSALPTTGTTTNVSSSRHRSAFQHSTSMLSTGASIETTAPTYVMVTADSKGQLKLLVNRLHR